MTTRQGSGETVRKITRLIQQRQLGQATVALSESHLSPETAEYHVLNCAIVNAAGDDTRTLALLETSRSQFPGAWQLTNMQLAIHLRRANRQGATHCINSLMASSAPAVIKLYAQVRFLAAQGNIAKAAELLEQSLAQQKIDLSGEIARDLFNYHYQLKQYASSLDWLEKALALNPMLDYESGNLVVVLSDCDPDDQGEARLAALLQQYPKNVSILESLCSVLLMRGKTDELEDLLARSADLDERSKGKLQRMAAAAGLEHLQVLQSAEREQVFDQYIARVDKELELARPVADGFPVNQNWLHVKGDSAAGSVIAFNGGGGHFGVPIKLFDRYLASLNLDAVYFRDNTRQFFFDGVEGVGNSMADITQKIDSLELPKPVYCISNSGGSFAALNYGLHRQVDGMVLFAPFTYLATDFSKISNYNPKFKVIADYLHRTYPAAIFDYKDAYAAQPSSFPVHFYYGEKDPTCERHVTRMQSIPNMHMHRVPGSAHLLVRFLGLRNELLPILATHLGSTE